LDLDQAQAQHQVTLIPVPGTYQGVAFPVGATYPVGAANSVGVANSVGAAYPVEAHPVLAKVVMDQVTLYTHVADFCFRQRFRGKRRQWQSLDSFMNEVKLVAFHRDLGVELAVQEQVDSSVVRKRALHQGLEVELADQEQVDSSVVRKRALHQGLEVELADQEQVDSSVVRKRALHWGSAVELADPEQVDSSVVRRRAGRASLVPSGEQEMSGVSPFDLTYVSGFGSASGSAMGSGTITDFGSGSAIGFGSSSASGASGYPSHPSGEVSGHIQSQDEKIIILTDVEVVLTFGPTNGPEQGRGSVEFSGEGSSQEHYAEELSISLSNSTSYEDYWSANETVDLLPEKREQLNFITEASDVTEQAPLNTTPPNTSILTTSPLASLQAPVAMEEPSVTDGNN
ncbi:hypothetical protein M9458_049411, partial [Cirrhinus mrigala]